MMRRPDETLLGAPPYFGSYHSPLPRLDLDYLYRIHSERILRRDGKPDHVERALRVKQAERDGVDIVAVCGWLTLSDTGAPSARR